MLYLAELNKPNFGRVTLLLLAKQIHQDNWQAVNEEAIPVEGRAAQDATRIKDGAMVLADVNNSRQAVQIREAAKQLVSYLQNYGRVQEKARSQEEEVEGWKKSLLFQQQALQTRELELAQRQEELEQIGLEYDQHVEELRQLDTRREEIQTQETYIAEQQNIIRQQRETLQRQIEDAQRSRLSEEEAQQLLTLLSQVQQQVSQTPTAAVLTASWQQWLTDKQQELAQQLTALGQEREKAQTRQNELDNALEVLLKRRQEWFKSRLAVDNAWTELRIQEALRRVRQEQIQQAIQSIQSQEDMLSFTYGLVKTYDFIKADGIADQMAAPTISLQELSQQVLHLQQQFADHSQQVSQQVAELEQAQTKVAELEAQLAKASRADRAEIEMDIDYEKAACAALSAGVLPQQERLQREHEELIRQESLLRKLKGEARSSASNAHNLPTVDVGSLIGQLETAKEQEEQQKERLEQQIQQLEAVLRAQQDQLTTQRHDIEQQWRHLEQEERNLREQLQGMAELWGRCNYQFSLWTSEQEKLPVLWQHLKTLQTTLDQQCQDSTASQTALTTIHSILTGLMAQQPVATA